LAWEAGLVEPAFQRPKRRSARRFEGHFRNRHTIEMAIEPDQFGQLICLTIASWRGPNRLDVAAMGTIKWGENTSASA